MEKWDVEKINAFRSTLLAWYDEYGRKQLPWRQNKDPYRILVSEIMLQQTQVNTVIPYFERFLATFPTESVLAQAPEQEVLKLWEGLGYYSRARNLQKAARFVVEELSGQWPTNRVKLQALPGVGPYTASAIASIAFDEVTPAIDGNAFRVFSRLLKIDADIADSKSRQIFYDAIAPIVDSNRPGDFNQAIMDLGTSYMTAKNPDSENSPVKQFNQAYLDGVEMNYPVKSKKIKVQKLQQIALALENEKGEMAYIKRPEHGLLADLWTFPLIDVTGANIDDLPQLAKDYLIEQGCGEYTFQLLNIQPIKHIFTHRKWEVWVLAAQILDENIGYLMANLDNDLPKPKIQEKIQQIVTNERIN